MKKKKIKGFTMVELLIVIAVSSILMTTIGFAIITFQRNFGEKTATHETAIYLEEIVKQIQLEFPGANTIPFIDSATLNFSPLAVTDGTFGADRFGIVKNIFIAKYDELFDTNHDYDTLKTLFISHYDSGSYVNESDIGVKVFDLDIYEATNDLTGSVKRMEYMTMSKPSDVWIRQATVTNEDTRWYLIGFFFKVRNYWYKDKSIEEANGKEFPYNVTLTVTTNLKIRN